MILAKTLDREEKFFKNIGHVTSILSKAFVLLRENRVEYLSDSNINTLLDGDELEYDLLLKKPQIIHNFGDPFKYQKHILKCNPFLSWPIYETPIEI